MHTLGDSEQMPIEATFRISSGLKNIIGQDLITNDYVAVFELVKNAYDANARKVEIHFIDEKIFIIDDGKGMSSEDIASKWLFVAYSAKSDGTEDVSPREKRVYAGSKGVGRFSCDRLGSVLKLQTKQASSKEVEIVDVDWNKFDIDLKNEFEDIKVKRQQSPIFDLPLSIVAPLHGTVLEISGLREYWPRDKLLALKGYLSKLINPIEGIADNFTITLFSSRDLQEDERVIKKAHSTLFDDNKINKAQEKDLKEFYYNTVVNGKIENFVFRELDDKTTKIEVYINDDGNSIITELKDRGESIYKIEESNNYPELISANLVSSIYYLNTSAKNTFTRRTGMKPVNFGSIFLFRNGFRVFPVGEPGDDTFGLDRRKNQGYARFLGTREVIGRIDVKGTEREFKESTSRDHGLIETRAYTVLRDFIWDKCIKRLENYVTGVNWEDKLDAEYETTERLRIDTNRARIAGIVSRLVNNDNVRLISYNRDLISILSEKAEEFEDSIKHLRILASKTNDENLNTQISSAEKRFKELQDAERLARAHAEEERKARRAAEEAARQAQAAQEKAETERQQVVEAFEEEKKRTLYLTALTSVDHDNLLKLNHQIDIYASEIHHLLLLEIGKLKNGHKFNNDELLSTFERISFRNQQITSTSRIITRANFRMDSEVIEGNLVEYMKQYIINVCNQYTGADLNILIGKAEVEHVINFRPIEIAMLIDNLVSNSIRAKADKITFDFTKPSSKILQVDILDDGKGFDQKIDRSRIWEKGFTTTSGSGLGLYHVKEIVDHLKASVDAIDGIEGGAGFRIKVPS